MRPEAETSGYPNDARMVLVELFEAGGAGGFEGFVFGYVGGVDFYAEAGAGGDCDDAVGVRTECDGGAGVGEIVVELFELVEGAGVGNGGDEVHHVEIAEAGGADVGDALLVEGGGHAGYFHAANHAAEVEHVLLHDADGVVG